MTGENGFTPELSEKEIFELLENANQEAQRKPQSVAWKYFKLKTWKLYFDNLSICIIQSKTMQVETIFTN